MASFPLRVSEADISELIGLTYQAALTGKAGWLDFLAKFGEVGDGLKTFFLIQSDHSNTSTGLLYDGFDPEWIAAFEAYYSAINPTPVKNFGIGDITTSGMMIDRTAMEASEFYNDWLRPQEDLIGAAAFTVTRSAEQVFIIGSSIRRRDADDKEIATARLLGLLKPHILRALKVQKTLCEQRIMLSLSARSAGEDLGIFVTQGHHSLVYANDFGESLLREADIVLHDELGRFRFADPENDKTHHDAIPAISDCLIGDVKSFSASIGGSSEFDYRCRITPLDTCNHLPGALAAIRAGSAGLNVLTIEKIRKTEDPTRMLATRYRLTQAEARVALKIAKGETLKQIAEAHAVALVTVRNQAKAAMSKVGVHRQIELALAVAKDIKA